MPDTLARFFQELAAAHTRAYAVEIFENADWVFVGMKPQERERAYERVTNIIHEKPE